MYTNRSYPTLSIIIMQKISRFVRSRPYVAWLGQAQLSLSALSTSLEIPIPIDNTPSFHLSPTRLLLLYKCAFTACPISYRVRYHGEAGYNNRKIQSTAIFATFTECTPIFKKQMYQLLTDEGLNIDTMKLLKRRFSIQLNQQLEERLLRLIKRMQIVYPEIVK